MLDTIQGAQVALASVTMGETSRVSRQHQATILWLSTLSSTMIPQPHDMSNIAPLGQPGLFNTEARKHVVQLCLPLSGLCLQVELGATTDQIIRRRKHITFGTIASI